MPIIYLEHPVHGRKIAVMEAEAQFDEKHGWTRFEPNAAPIISAIQLEEAPPVNALQMKRKYNRKVVLQGH